MAGYDSNNTLLGAVGKTKAAMGKYTTWIIIASAVVAVTGTMLVAFIKKDDKTKGLHTFFYSLIGTGVFGLILGGVLGQGCCKAHTQQSDIADGIGGLRQ